MEFIKKIFGFEKVKKCGGCKLKPQQSVAEFTSQLNTLKAQYNDLELEMIELNNVNSELTVKNKELKEKNEELINILIKVSDIARVGVECSKKGY